MSKCFLLASTINLTTAFFFTFFLRGSLSSHPHQKTNLDQHKKQQIGEEMFSELLQTSKPLSRRVRVGWTSCWEKLTALGESEGEVSQEAKQYHTQSARNICQRPRGPPLLGLTETDSLCDQRRGWVYLLSTPHCSLVNQEHCSEATCIDL